MQISRGPAGPAVPFERTDQSPHLASPAATWLMQNGVDKWEAAGFLGMSVEMLDRVYGHHHPEHLRGAAHALGYRRSQSLAITLAPGRRPRPLDREPVENIGGPGNTHILPNILCESIRWVGVRNGNTDKSTVVFDR